MSRQGFGAGKWTSPTHEVFKEAKGEGPTRLQPRHEHVGPMAQAAMAKEYTKMLSTPPAHLPIGTDPTQWRLALDKMYHEKLVSSALEKSTGGVDSEMAKSFQKWLAGKLPYGAAGTSDKMMVRGKGKNRRLAPSGDKNAEYNPVLGLFPQAPIWGTLNQPLLNVPGVKDYLLNNFDKRREFEDYMSLMAKFGPVGPNGEMPDINTLFLYYKYHILRLPVPEEDDAFLSDYQLFHRGDPTTPGKLLTIDQTDLPHSVMDNNPDWGASEPVPVGNNRGAKTAGNPDLKKGSAAVLSQQGTTAAVAAARARANADLRAHLDAVNAAEAQAQKDLAAADAERVRLEAEQLALISKQGQDQIAEMKKRLADAQAKKLAVDNLTAAQQAEMTRLLAEIAALTGGANNTQPGIGFDQAMFDRLTQALDALKNNTNSTGAPMPPPNTGPGGSPPPAPPAPPTNPPGAPTHTPPPTQPGPPPTVPTGGATTPPVTSPQPDPIEEENRRLREALDRLLADQNGGGGGDDDNNNPPQPPGGGGAVALPTVPAGQPSGAPPVAPLDTGIPIGGQAAVGPGFLGAVPTTLNYGSWQGTLNARVQHMTGLLQTGGTAGLAEMVHNVDRILTELAQTPADAPWDFEAQKTTFLENLSSHFAEHGEGYVQHTTSQLGAELLGFNRDFQGVIGHDAGSMRKRLDIIKNMYDWMSSQAQSLGRLQTTVPVLGVPLTETAQQLVARTQANIRSWIDGIRLSPEAGNYQALIGQLEMYLDQMGRLVMPIQPRNQENYQAALGYRSRARLGGIPPVPAAISMPPAPTVPSVGPTVGPSGWALPAPGGIGGGSGPPTIGSTGGLPTPGPGFVMPTPPPVTLPTPPPPTPGPIPPTPTVPGQTEIGSSASFPSGWFASSVGGGTQPPQGVTQPSGAPTAPSSGGVRSFFNNFTGLFDNKSTKTPSGAPGAQPPIGRQPTSNPAPPEVKRPDALHPDDNAYYQEYLNRMQAGDRGAAKAWWNKISGDGKRKIHHMNRTLPETTPEGGLGDDREKKQKVGGKPPTRSRVARAPSSAGGPPADAYKHLTSGTIAPEDWMTEYGKHAQKLSAQEVVDAGKFYDENVRPRLTTQDNVRPPKALKPGAGKAVVDNIKRQIGTTKDFPDLLVKATSAAPRLPEADRRELIDALALEFTRRAGAAALKPLFPKQVRFAPMPIMTGPGGLMDLVRNQPQLPANGTYTDLVRLRGVGAQATLKLEEGRKKLEEQIAAYDERIDALENEEFNQNLKITTNLVDQAKTVLGRNPTTSELEVLRAVAEATQRRITKPERTRERQDQIDRLIAERNQRFDALNALGPADDPTKLKKRLPPAPPGLSQRAKKLAVMPPPDAPLRGLKPLMQLGPGQTDPTKDQNLIAKTLGVRPALPPVISPGPITGPPERPTGPKPGSTRGILSKNETDIDEIESTVTEAEEVAKQWGDPKVHDRIEKDASLDPKNPLEVVPPVGGDRIHGVYFNTPMGTNSVPHGIYDVPLPPRSAGAATELHQLIQWGRNMDQLWDPDPHLQALLNEWYGEGNVPGELVDAARLFSNLPGNSGDGRKVAAAMNEIRETNGATAAGGALGLEVLNRLIRGRVSALQEYAKASQGDLEARFAIGSEYVRSTTAAFSGPVFGPSVPLHTLPSEDEIRAKVSNNLATIGAGIVASVAANSTPGFSAGVPPEFENLIRTRYEARYAPLLALIQQQTSEAAAARYWTEIKKLHDEWATGRPAPDPPLDLGTLEDAYQRATLVAQLSPPGQVLARNTIFAGYTAVDRLGNVGAGLPWTPTQLLTYVQERYPQSASMEARHLAQAIRDNAADRVIRWFQLRLEQRLEQTGLIDTTVPPVEDPEIVNQFAFKPATQDKGKQKLARRNRSDSPKNKDSFFIFGPSQANKKHKGADSDSDDEWETPPHELRDHNPDVGPSNRRPKRNK